MDLSQLEEENDRHLTSQLLLVITGAFPEKGTLYSKEIHLMVESTRQKKHQKENGVPALEVKNSLKLNQ